MDKPKPKRSKAKRSIAAWRERQWNKSASEWGKVVAGLAVLVAVFCLALADSNNDAARGRRQSERDAEVNAVVRRSQQASEPTTNEGGTRPPTPSEQAEFDEAVRKHLEKRDREGESSPFDGF
jgi:hypothetical protein